MNNLLTICIVFLLLSCQKNYSPHTGDLVFQDLDCGDLCMAIEKVTTSVDKKSFSHVGIVSIENGAVFVYEAIGPGVIKTPFEKFLNRSKDKNNQPKVYVGRIKTENMGDSVLVLKRINLLLGKPYDDEFDIKNEKYYCSELVYEVFKDNFGKSLFYLNPMTFKDPSTGKTFPVWDEYFKNLKIAVPEGLPGLNPGSISRSPQIDIIFKYY